MTDGTFAPMTVRAATRADLEAVEELLMASKLPTAGVREALDDFLVAEVDGRIIGVAGMEYAGESGLLRSTAVSPQWRGYRVARRLVERLIADATSRGVRELYLLTTTAASYFPHFGFVETTRQSVPMDLRQTVEFQGACPSTATVMHLQAPTPPISSTIS